MSSTPGVTLRRARTADVGAIRRLVDLYAAQRILLGKDLVTLYEDVPDFRVATDDAGTVIGCGALHVMWHDLAEVRTIAVDPRWRRRGIGSLLVAELLRTAADLGVDQVFCLTFEVEFFASLGFEVTDVPVRPEVFAQMVRSTDEGIAEFLDLARVRPNTLGNTRMVYRIR